MNHPDYMQRAISLAKNGLYTVSPNPMVGCIIVNQGQIVGAGYHQRAGEAHAEIFALKEAGEKAKNATVYITLEPCCHTGRTPPCTDALIKAGIKTIYIACQDPNALVAGKGVLSLKQHGIEIFLGLCEKEASQLNKIFFHYIQTKRPFVYAKWAMSLDGKMITHPIDSKAISSDTSQQQAHALRRRVDAILIGANTARDDNPLLTARKDNANHDKQPIRIILSGKHPLPLTLNIFDLSLASKTIVITHQHTDKHFLEKLNEKNIQTLFMNANNDGLIDIKNLLDELGKLEITSLLVEGGMHLLQQFFAAEMINQFEVYLSPFLIGDMPQKKSLVISEINKLDVDYQFIAKFKEIENV